MGGSVATAIYTAIINNGFAEHRKPIVRLIWLPQTANINSVPGEIDNALVHLNFPSASIPALLKAAALNTAAAYKAVPGITGPVTAAAQLAVKKAYVSAFST
jgi:hypothetical protein